MNIPEDHFQIDETNSLIVSHIENIESYNDLSTYSDLILSLNTVNYTFSTVPNNINYTNSYIVNGSSKQYILYFTQLPIISIDTPNTILDDPKVLANFTYSDDEQVLTSNIGIELRGGSSRSYPKKTYDLEFWEDDNGEDTHNVQFKNLRSDDDWILDALYNEPLRLRSYTSSKLWLSMHTPYYLKDEPEAKAGANVEYVEMFLNGRYNGIYNISEQVDKKQLKLKSFKKGEIRGELYKGISWSGATKFSSISNYDNNNRVWSDYEMKYPKEDEATDWENPYNFTDFVMNSSNTDFTNNIWSKFNYDNYLDYFIFLNLLRATDNRGKNIYLAKYKADEPYYYVPWDLDGCFGTIWNGTNENITDDILTNGFHDRVIKLNLNNYETTIANKWFDYRNNILEENKLIESIEKQYQFLSENKIYERESIVYPNYNYNEQTLSYLISWLQNRLSFLDTYYGDLLSIDNINLNKTELSFSPNPAKTRIHINNTNKLINSEYKIYDFLGRQIDKGEINNNTISIEKLKLGNYIIILNNEAHKLVIK
ncbi:hypothetical protein A8C32_17090 [Flavivirga aquatica]|uniref:Secretion system C-terminal sorting domain-containing protein n=1 Tax=Flavivirga aquatica TaxID=1849968 RepID=A0A1E5T8J7_9FLAO|nr:hypothetical protein A8C32_17090 [Flavivirga aquatica]